MKNLAIIIPTYNERDNIKRLLGELLELYPEAKIFIVDDSSPDRTAEVVRRFAQQHPNVRLILRNERDGMASAYLDAFGRVIPDEGVHHIATMDADLSHDPDDLAKLLAHIGEHDVVVGSRYVPGGRIKNWAFWRLFISKYGSIYTKAVTGMPVRDLTSGFVVYSREALAKVLPHARPRHPYAYQTEMKYLAHKTGASIKEAPIIFRERTTGKSKFKGSAILEALVFPWYLRFFK